MRSGVLTPQRYNVPTLYILAFFVVLTLVMTWPWALHMGEAINPFGDVVVQMTSLRWDAHALVTNPTGLFEAPFFFPYAHSLAFSENLLGQALTALPILLVIDNPALAANFNILLSFVLTGFFTYLLVRDLTGSTTAGLLSGIAFAFCPFRFMQMGHLHMLATEWFPFTLWALGSGLGIGKRQKAQASPAGEETGREMVGARTSVRGSYIAWAAFGFVAMGLSSIYYIYFLAMAVVLYLVWWVAVEARSGAARIAWRPALLKLGIAALAVGVLLAPVFLPYIQSNRELGFSRTTYEVQNWQAEWSFFGNVLQSNWLYGKIIAPAMASAGGERELFPGIVATLLALLGIVWGRGRGRFFYVLLGFAALVLTFGLRARLPLTSIEIPLPYALLYDWVPGFRALRVPVRFAVLLDFSIYVLAGYGLAQLLARLASNPGTRNLKAQLAAFGLSGLVLLEFINPLDTSNHRDVTALLRDTEPYGWLARPENSGPVVELPMTAGQDDVWYTFFDTRHWQPLVNGWSSFVPPGTVHIKQALDTFPDPLSLTLLQGLEVRHVVVHLWQFPADAQSDLKTRLRKARQLVLDQQFGENYVYDLAPDPWLRQMAGRIGKGTLWIGEARQDAMTTLETLAYALQRYGLSRDRMGGNINIGFQPIGSLPFGTPADYALVPNIPGSADAPFGYEEMLSAEDNPMVRLLKRNPSLTASYDMLLKDTPKPGPNGLQMQVGPSAISFGGSDTSTGSMPAVGPTRTLDLSFVAFTPSEVVVQIGERAESIRLRVGVSHYRTQAFVTPPKVLVTQRGGDMRLLRIDLRSDGTAGGQGTLESRGGLMPLEINSSKSGSMLDTRLRVVAPKQDHDYTVTLDVYSEPWGTHPDGHFGSWSVVLPADAGAHDYNFHLDPIKREVAATRDGGSTQVFGWIGPPSQGDFRAILSVLRGDTTVSSTTLYLFTRKGTELTGWLPEPNTFSVVKPEGNKSKWMH